MNTALALIRGIGWFRVGRSVPLPVTDHERRSRIYWLTLPLVEITVLRWGIHLYLGPDYGFLSVEIEPRRWPVTVGFVTDGWRDWS